MTATPDTQTEMIECTYCGAPFDLRRKTILGYRHCTATRCVNAWRRDRIVDEDLHLILVPKSGMTWIRGSQAQSGKSSGR